VFWLIYKEPVSFGFRIPDRAALNDGDPANVSIASMAGVGTRKIQPCGCWFGVVDQLRRPYRL
jgi:hypothetical protein